MSEMTDAYQNGCQILLNCLECQTRIFTPKDNTDVEVLLIASEWIYLHNERFPNHTVDRIMYYYA